MASSGPGAGTGDGFPGASRYLDRLQMERFYQLHRAKLAEQSTTLDTTSPKEFPHLFFNLKKLQKEEEQMAQVEYENAVMMAHVEGILSGPGRIDNWNFYLTKSLNRDARVKEQIRITKENHVLGRRLENSKPRYTSGNLKDHVKQHKYLMSLLDRSTKDWTMRGKAKPALWKPSRFPKSRQSNVHYSYLPNTPPPPPPPDSVKLPHIDDPRSKRQPSKDRRSADSEDSVELESLPQPDRDAALLRRLCRGKGDIEDVLVRTLLRRSRAERLKIQNRFKEAYGLDLIGELKSELGDEYDLVVDLLLRRRSAWEAARVHEVLTSAGLGRKGAVLTEMLLSRLKMEIREIELVYEAAYGRAFEDAVGDNLDGDVGVFVTALLHRADGDAAAGPTEGATPKEDAEALETVPPVEWIVESGGGDGRLTRMLKTSTLAHVRSTVEAFDSAGWTAASTRMSQRLAEHHSPEMVDAFETFLSWLQNPYSFYAGKAREAIVDGDVDGLVSLLITRAEEGHMPMVRKMYRKKWEADIVDDVGAAVPGGVGKLLVDAAKMTKMLTPTLEPRKSSDVGGGGGAGDGAVAVPSAVPSKGSEETSSESSSVKRKKKGKEEVEEIRKEEERKDEGRKGEEKEREETVPEIRVGQSDVASNKSGRGSEKYAKKREGKGGKESGREEGKEASKEASKEAGKEAGKEAISEGKKSSSASTKKSAASVASAAASAASVSKPAAASSSSPRLSASNKETKKSESTTSAKTASAGSSKTASAKPASSAKSGVEGSRSEKSVRSEKSKS